MLFDLKEIVEQYGLKGKIIVWKWPYCKKRYVARRLIKKAVKEGRLKKHQRIVEWSSGNLAREVCNVASILMHPVSIIEGSNLKGKLPDWVEVIHPSKLLKDEKEQQISKKLLHDITQKYACNVNGCYLGQLVEEEHIKVYEEFAQHLIKQLPKIDAFIEHVGSGATFIGMGNVFKEKFEDMQVIAYSKVWKDIQDAIVFKIPFNYTMLNNSDFTKYANTIQSSLKNDYGILKSNHGIKNICAAMEWLKENPNSTIFTTIGD